MRVLIAEDNRVSRTLLKTHLEKWGHEPVTTVDGSEAWVALQADDDLYLRMVVAPVYASAELIHDRWPTEDSAIGLGLGGGLFAPSQAEFRDGRFKDEGRDGRLEGAAALLARLEPEMEQVRAAAADTIAS